MGNAIKKVFPNTRHRYCAWHIKKHELEHLQPLITRYSDFKESYRQWVKSDTTEEFETNWEVLRADSRRAAEEDEDFKTMNSNPILSSVHPIEAKAGQFYTRNFFEHSLYVMKKRHVENLPGHYILPRWTLSARYKVDTNSIGLEDVNCENGVSALTLWCVRSNCDKAIEQASDSLTKIEKFNSSVIKFLEDQKIRKKA
ncbi:unnamed protein product [Lactuca saligna]|uniref:Protein FAR1-RELATED SEQUENCE n=1 Tax=Lactuca saligna TaxID=75948 RepID=A0AA36ECF0_LACSI|nr:unnamed protein product [Lactuca saligna]